MTIYFKNLKINNQMKRQNSIKLTVETFKYKILLMRSQKTKLNILKSDPFIYFYNVTNYEYNKHFLFSGFDYKKVNYQK